MDDTLVEVVELPRDAHPWFLACQAHPEFLSTPRDGHPLFIGSSAPHASARPAASCFPKRAPDL